MNFTTSKETRWRTDARKCHVNWVVCDSDWEAEFCRVAEAHPAVAAYVKNQNLGLEVPYLMGSVARKYLPDFIVRVDDGGAEPLNLIVEIKGYRGEDAKEKANAMRAYWVPGVNGLGRFGRWAFAEFTEVFEIDAAFSALVDEFIRAAGTGGTAGLAKADGTTPVSSASHGDIRYEHQALYRGGTGRAEVNAQTDRQPPGAMAGKTQGKTRTPATQLSGLRRGRRGGSLLIYQRQSLEDEQDFSCGIAYLPRGAPPLTLARYNGPSHEHGDIAYRQHIHRASEAAIAVGRKAEADATETGRFETVDGALACLTEDFAVSGVDVRHDEPRG